MRWRKLGRIFDPQDNQSGWVRNYAQLPVPDVLNNGRVRVYFSTRDKQGRSLTTFLEIAESDPTNVLYVHDSPILDLGKPGTFDESGVMPSCLYWYQGVAYLFYIGWNQRVTVPYHLSIGMAESHDGIAFRKVSEGPLLDRDREEPFFNTAPWVIRTGAGFRLFYSSGTGWVNMHGQLEPEYDIKSAVSTNLLNWQREGRARVQPEATMTSLGKPCVVKYSGRYHMFFSERGSHGYRDRRDTAYRIKYAISEDGETWERRHDEIGIDRSDQGWDSTMMEYASVYRVGSELYMLYNGDGFGYTGFGAAVLEIG